MSKATTLDAAGEWDVAIVGMAAHLPGAADISVFWDNLRNGRSAIRKLSEQELREAGEAPHLIGRDDYVPFAALLDGFDRFDAEFFGFSPKEAAIMDPQHRQFLETAWEAMENAAHMPETFPGPIGVFAGCGMGSYFYFNICSNRDLVEETGMFLLRHSGNDKDFLSTRLSHIFDLQGPSVNIQTACSTSLVATHQACQSLLNGECDMALAGGVTIELPHARGYVFKEGEILSPDGACHAFDHRAQGTVFGSGVGVVALRRLRDAIADGDHIWAVIKGSAVNNDGAAKAGYLAPSVEGQADAIAEAHAISGIDARSISYVECHGTGTYLGDPIEVAALTDAFRRTTDAEDFCRIGSVKTNIGHLDTAAGVASLIKASLALHNREMPPSIGFEKPNPAIAFDGSPFRVNDSLTEWPAGPGPRRAGVNSLGVGGTNAHVVLEEAPERAASGQSDWPFQLLTLSARSKTALDEASGRLAAHLRDHPEQPLADVAFTLKEGRRAFEKRRVVVADSHGAAAETLEQNDPRRVFTHTVVSEDPDPVFMFPGGGAQYAGMARDLYETEPEFRDWMDRGLDILEPKLDYDIRALWLPDSAEAAKLADERLRKPSIQLPLIMIVEYALARLWMSWGVTPGALIGHSMGENTAACLAGVMSFEDCIGLVHLRGRLFDTVPPGGMLSVALSASALREHLGPELDLAAINAPGLSVATGPRDALDRLAKSLEAQDIDCQIIPIDIAAHSRMLEPILTEFGDYLRGITLSAPELPVISNRTGKPLTAAEATDPEYWVSHLRNTVDFEGGLSWLATRPDRIYIEVGPGKALSSLAGQHGSILPNQVIGSLRHPKDDIADDAYFMAMLGRVWAMGGRIDWDQIWGDARRNRVVLPSYPFQRSRYFIDRQEPGEIGAEAWLMRSNDPAEWRYAPVWTPRYADCVHDVDGGLSRLPDEKWLVFLDDTGLAARAADRLREAGQTVVTVRAGDAFIALGDHEFALAPEHGRAGYDALIRDLALRDLLPDRIGHFWLVTADERHRPGSSFFHRTQEQGFWSLFHLAQALGEEAPTVAPHIVVVTSDMMQARAEPLPYPEKSTVMGAARVIPRELPGYTCAVLDIGAGKPGAAKAGLDQTVLEELLATPANTVAAHRSDRRLELSYRKLPFEGEVELMLAPDSTVLVTGGFGGIGLTVAEELVRRFGARIALVSRSTLPERASWGDMIARLAPGDRLRRRMEAVERIEAAGGRVLTVAADVSNIEEMRDAKLQIETELGPVRAIVHAAGVIDDAPLLSKNPMAIEDVFTPKIHGTQVLDALFPDGSVEWIALFSSSSTVTAPAGQVDYVAANEYLNAYAKSRAQDKTSVVAINWGIWSDVGMAADAMQARVGMAPQPVEPVTQPLLQGASFDHQGNRIFTGTLSTDQWILDEHRTKAGDALLPGTGYLSLAAQALAAQGEGGCFELRDMNFLRPLRVGDGKTSKLRVTLPRTETGYDFLIDTQPEGAGAERVAEGQIDLLPMAPPPSLDLVEIGARCSQTRAAPPGETLVSPQEAHLDFGPRWRVLQQVALGEGEGLANLRLPKAAIGDEWPLHPALMDLATGWAMDLISGYAPDHLWVPVSYHSVRIYRALPGDIVSWVRNSGDNRADGQTATFDITITTADGAICAEIRGFSIRKMDGALSFAAPVSPGAPDAPRPLSAAEQRLKHNLTQGIRADEGVELFLRAMAGGQSQVIVSSLDLDALTRQAEAGSADDRSSGANFDRPELDSEYAPPENAIEEKLAEFWGDLLGVAEIGVNDSFFDLGGHSLIAVRLFAKVKKAFGVDFPISVLFEAPTIRSCAALLAERGVRTDDGAEAAPSTAKPPERRFTHLVPMHQGEGGPLAPFFLVAGMFGNVLNLRHLAHLLGTDRPVYGLQAKGLFGEVEPHRDLTEAARDMIAEMRQIQPSGPYMIGGFSGGGITAYDIARQLKDAGERVDVLVMLDTPLPQRRPLSRRDKNMIHVLEFKAQGPSYPFRWVAGKLRDKLGSITMEATDETAAAQFHDARIEAAFYDAIARYEVSAWDGPLTLFRPPLVGRWEVAPGKWISSERAYVLPDNDWTGFAPNIQVIEVPGDHDSMVLEPNVRVLAARMRRLFEAAEASGPSRSLPDWTTEEAAQ
ncbi:SDR family NAD(P)-dependent oxidoreductase [Ponticoccus sp. SC2-23]|uniref:type I polyketide synthase n=1 Tax=Alexandriicola marinus TaxID=2081710 RepID=UPI000FDC4A7D|nr:type I polyketide synthase [Alexandriicola marinus]MBM1220410.1 SDR family NAD(P)-dependent oxidoreductase [Ponticoccus sp. SC6-9]MBM1225096.1 SDR family NAD(P)-dependent oxidoreductase [Ponticoccus sp. SC6-15]MBM1228610.1 SDR family NAD(P)-dependent oxidoreductase [Ponticoccus sp. SC6-38]MBM1233753.1 SDR family NAD(P)-dependent oxidoreductase [Ponticoccus sp. SC6-45]MBM1239111.1 SDR family NAD(P)-dependent oxidoreductase [Ponticoccus sp. SC6-49]MBM1242893.1 SDR family NAD(P)-dependent oxi